MAQIPLGAGRRVTPGGYNGPNASPAAFGSQVGQAMEQLGNTAINIGIGQLQDQARQRAIEDQQRRQDLEAADKAAGIAALGTAKIQMREGVAGVAQRVLSGELDDVNARDAWDGIRSRVLEDSTRDLPAHMKETVAGAVKQQAAELASVELGNASRTRLREVTRANLLTSIEGYERDALDNRPKALQMATSALESLGPAAGMGPDDQVRTLQGFRERTAYNAGDRLLLAAGRSIPALDQVQARINKTDFADLSPERRQTLEVRIANRKQSILHEQEVIRNRAEAAAAKHLRDAEHTYNAAQGVVDGGAMLDDASVASMERQVAGTPYAAAFKALVSSGAQRASFGSLTPDQQQTTLQQLRAEIAQNGASPATVDRLRKFDAIASKTDQAVKEDPLAWGLQSRLLRERVPLEMSSFDAIARSVGARVEQAGIVGAQLKRPVSPLFAQEATALATMLGGLPPAQRATAIQTLAGVIPADQAQALAMQMDEKDRPTAIAFALGAQRTSLSRPTGELVLRGAAAIKDKSIKLDDRAVDGWSAQAARELDGVFGSPQRTSMITDASKYIVAGWVGEGAIQSPGNGDVKRAVNMAVGGEVIDFNGSKIVRPAGVDQRTFDARIRRYPADELTAQLPDGKVYLRGQPVDAAKFLAGLPSAKLRTLGRGVYGVLEGGTFAANQAGEPIVIEVTNAR